MTAAEFEARLFLPLIFAVRQLSYEQIAALCEVTTDSGRRWLNRRLQVNIAAKLLVERQLLACPLLELKAPLSTWSPWQREPNFEALSWQAISRWTSGPQRTRIVLAGPVLLRLYDGTAKRRIKNLCQVTHDLHVSQIFLRYCSSRPSVVRQWISEDRLLICRRGQKLPDAGLGSDPNHLQLAIEFGGRYTAARLREFHADCAAALAYEIW